MGYLSLAQFEVMASPGSAFRLSNAQAELDRAGVGRFGVRGCFSAKHT